MSSNKELSLKQIMGFRKEKLDTLREMGVNPYPYSFDLKNNTLEILQNVFRKRRFNVGDVCGVSPITLPAIANPPITKSTFAKSGISISTSLQ